MALQTIVKISNVTNLSDARYCAGMGVLHPVPEPTVAALLLVGIALMARGRLSTRG